MRRLFRSPAVGVVLALVAAYYLFHAVTGLVSGRYAGAGILLLLSTFFGLAAAHRLLWKGSSPVWADVLRAGSAVGVLVAVLLAASFSVDM